MRKLSSFIALLMVLSLFPVSAVASSGHDVIGVYRGAAAPDRIDKYAEWLGKEIDIALDFEAQDSWDGIAGPDWILAPWSKSKYKDKLMLSIPMLPKDPETTLEIGATGEYDGHFKRLAENLIKYGMPNTMIRIGWEMNGGWYRWTAKGGSEENYANYWKKIVDAMRSVPGQNFTFVWNPNTGETVDLEKAYPGNEYVDIIAIDVYDQSWLQGTYGSNYIENFHNLTEQEKYEIWKIVWNEKKNLDWGLEWFAEFARKNNKPLGVAEWGVLTRSDKHGGWDNPYFIQWMHDWMEENDVIFSMYFDFADSAGTYNGMLSSVNTIHPRSAAKFLELWGEQVPVEKRAEERLENAIVLKLGNSDAFVNNSKVKIDANPDVKPVEQDGRTLIPVRFISENMYGDILWDGEKSEVTIKMGPKIIKFIIGSKEYTVDGKKLQLDVPAQILNDRTVIPLRALVEAMGMEVFWDDRGLIVFSTTENLLIAELDKILIDYTVNKFSE